MKFVMFLKCKLSNPNVASLNADKEASGRGKSRVHDVTWPAFDSNKQEYIVIGEFSLQIQMAK